MKKLDTPVSKKPDEFVFATPINPVEPKRSERIVARRKINEDQGNVLLSPTVALTTGQKINAKKVQVQKKSSRKRGRPFQKMYDKRMLYLRFYKKKERKNSLQSPSPKRQNQNGL